MELARENGKLGINLGGVPKEASAVCPANVINEILLPSTIEVTM
jgi:hypothetical protein